MVLTGRGVRQQKKRLYCYITKLSIRPRNGTLRREKKKTEK